MNGVPQWERYARDAAASVARVPSAPGPSGAFTLVFQCTGEMRGAVHLLMAQAQLTPGVTAAFEARFRREAEAANKLVSVIWSGVMGLPTAGDRHEVSAGVAVVTSFTPMELPQAITSLRITRTIDAARELSQDAVLQIGKEVGDVYELSRSHAVGLKQVSEQFSETRSTNGQATIAQHIGGLTSHIQRFGQEIIERSARTAHDIDQARTLTGSIVKIGRTIDDVASCSRVLSMNARIEAGRCGEVANGFKIIATEMDTLAKEVARANRDISTLAETLTVLLPTLAAESARTEAHARGTVQVVEKQLAALQAQLATARVESFDVLIGSTRAANELHSKASAILQQLQFQDRSSQMLVEATEQAAALVELAGVRESALEKARVDQVGKLGRAFSGQAAVLESGSMLMF